MQYPWSCCGDGPRAESQLKGKGGANDKDEEFGMEKTLDICQLKADESATDQLIALYKASKEFTGDRENDVDICAILVKKNSNNKEFEEV